MTGELEALTYELSQRMLAQQEMRLDELRARTGTLLAASSVATSFLGPRAIDRDWVNTLALLARAAFAFSVIGSVRLGYWLELFFDQNQPTVDRLFFVYQVAAIAVLVEVILWTIEIAT
jgi:hypothetical protein